MYVLGFTPTDAQITALGFHFISAFVGILFIKTKLGYALLSISLIALVLKKLFVGKLNAALIKTLIIILLTAFFINQSSKELNYQSIQERDGLVSSNQQKIFTWQNMPLIFVYSDSMLNNVVGSVISFIDSKFPQDVSFLKAPFLFEKQGILAKENILRLKGGPQLRREIDAFIYDEFKEAYKLNNKAELKLTNNLRESFSRKGQVNLKALEGKIDVYFQNDEIYQNTTKQLEFLAPEINNIDEQIRNEVLLYQNNPSTNSLNKVCIYLIDAWPFIIGFLNALLWCVFLPVFLIVVMTHQITYLITWIINLILIKFAWVSGYLAHLSSVIILKQQLSQSDVAVYFYHPYFAYSAVLMMYVGVIMLFIIGFQSKPLTKKED